MPHDRIRTAAEEGYVRKHDIGINNNNYSVTPLCHPLNVARLGAFSEKWAELHGEWIFMKQ